MGWKHEDELVEHTGTAAVKRTDGTEADPQEIRNVLALNRAVYDLLRARKWAP